MKTPIAVSELIKLGFVKEHNYYYLRCKDEANKEEWYFNSTVPRNNYCEIIWMSKVGIPSNHLCHDIRSLKDLKEFICETQKPKKSRKHWWMGGV